MSVVRLRPGVAEATWSLGLATLLCFGQAVPYAAGSWLHSLLPRAFLTLEPVAAVVEQHLRSPSWIFGCCAFGLVAFLALRYLRIWKAQYCFALWALLVLVYLLPSTVALAVRSSSAEEAVGNMVISLLLPFTYTLSGWVAMLCAALVIVVGRRHATIDDRQPEQRPPDRAS